MTPLLVLLTRGLPPGAWRIDRFDTSRDRLVRAFGFRVAVIDVDPNSPKHQLLDLVATQLGFPRWFGRNWDALHDCLFDVAPQTNRDAEQEPILIVARLIGASRPIEAGAIPPESPAATLIDILADDAEPAGLCVVFAGIEAGAVPTADPVG